MASTYSPLLRFELVASGEQAGLWGNTENVQLGTLLEQALAGMTVITLPSTSDYTLSTLNGTPDEARAATLVVSGTPGGQTNVIIPALQKQYQVRNTTPSTIIIKTSAQVGGVTLMPGGATRIYCDGVNAYSGIEKIMASQLNDVSQSGGASKIVQLDSRGNLGAAAATTGTWDSGGGSFSLPTSALGYGAVKPVYATELPVGAFFSGSWGGNGSHLGLTVNGQWIGGAAGAMKIKNTGYSSMYVQGDSLYWWGSTISQTAGSNANYAMQMYLDCSNGNLVTRFNLGISDAKFKTALKPIANALTKVKALTGYTYKRLDAPKRAPRATGLVAQELAKVLPEAVQAIDQEGTLAIAYGHLAGLFVEAIKELEGRVAQLEAQLRGQH